MLTSFASNHLVERPEDLWVETRLLIRVVGLRAARPTHFLARHLVSFRR